MFSIQPEVAAHTQGLQHWFKVENVNELYQRHIDRGAKIISPIDDRPWGVREYVVEDPNGYHLRFAGPLEAHVEPSTPLDENVVIQRRLPTVAEYQALSEQVFDRKDAPSSVLERTWKGIVCTNDSGEAIGMVRVMYDAPGWFSIWDVAVLPAWQGKRIGQNMMKEALAMIHEESPGSFVFLFTFKHGFYEKIGFDIDSVSMRKV